jgi:hypothetical protein
VSDDLNSFVQIFERYAEALDDAPHASRLARLARTATRVPDALLDDLAELIVRLDDVVLVGNDISVALLDVGFCDVKFADATAFSLALKRRLHSYVEDPEVAASARGNLKERAAWWRMALGRAGELCRWPAIVLMKNEGSSSGRRM